MKQTIKCRHGVLCTFPLHGNWTGTLARSALYLPQGRRGGAFPPSERSPWVVECGCCSWSSSSAKRMAPAGSLWVNRSGALPAGASEEETSHTIEVLQGSMRWRHQLQQLKPGVHLLAGILSLVGSFHAMSIVCALRQAPSLRPQLQVQYGTGLSCKKATFGHPRKQWNAVKPCQPTLLMIPKGASLMMVVMITREIH